MKSSGLEELHVVFSLKVDVVARQILGDRTFDVLASEQIDMLSVLYSVKRVLDQLEVPAKFCLRDGKAVSEKQVEGRIRKTGKWIQGLQVNGLMLGVGDIPGRRQSFVTLEEKTIGAASSWDAWVSPFLEASNFVQAWVTNVDYDYWQNASDPLHYKVAGRDMTGLKTKSNGLPPPVEQTIVDTSENPGRWEFRRGFVEAIGSPMWFGKNFWKLIGGERERALASIKWLHLSEPEKGILRVSSDVPFNDETTASEQNALRAAIYGP